MIGVSLVNPMKTARSRGAAETTEKRTSIASVQTISQFLGDLRDSA